MMLRWFVAATPMLGVLIFPIVVPFTINRFGLAPGVLTALLISTIWFAAMLRTSEMPH